MNIIIFDVHHPEDGRINRHIKYMQNLGYNLIHININRYFPFLKTGSFSRNGEIGYRLCVGDYSHSIKNRILSQLFFLTPILAIKLWKFLKNTNFDRESHCIIHIHDYELLFTGYYLHFFISKHVKIVYDRHELYETKKGKNWILDKIPRIYEQLSSRWIDGIVGVSHDHIELLKSQFKRSKIVIVPNYPDTTEYSKIDLESKISLLDHNYLKMVYFGSLDVTLDRDIFLILRVMQVILQQKKYSEAFIGGITSHPNLLSALSDMVNKYPGRFHFLGHVSYKEVLSYTSQATIGFLFIKPDYWVKVSANKVYEYLHYGVIPIIKANIENYENVSECSLIFSQNTKDEDIVSSVSDLISEKNRIKRMMSFSYDIGNQYTFDSVKKRYKRLYQEIYNHGFTQNSH